LWYRIGKGRGVVANQRGSRRALGVDAARRVERRPQHGTEDQDADAGGDPHPIADSEAKDDQHQKRRDGRRRAGVVIVMTVIHGALDLRSYVRVSRRCHNSCETHAQTPADSNVLT
jgi:hypothetical protein